MHERRFSPRTREGEEERGRSRHGSGKVLILVCREDLNLDLSHTTAEGHTNVRPDIVNRIRLPKLLLGWREAELGKDKLRNKRLEMGLEERPSGFRLYAMD